MARIKTPQWYKRINKKLSETQQWTKSQYEHFQNRQEAYSRISDQQPKIEPPKRITWVTAIRIVLAELGEPEYWRTLWHLLWRPGYVIADYLNGKRRHFLRPFELLIATTIMLSIVMVIVPAELPKEESLELMFQEKIEDDTTKEDILHQNTAVYTQAKRVLHYLDNYRRWKLEHQAFSLLVQSIFVMSFTWLLFRKSPRKRCPFVPEDPTGKAVNYNFPEILTAQIFVLSQLQLVNTVWVLVAGWFVPTLTFQPFAFPNIITHIIIFIDYQQLFGKKWYSTLWRTFFCVPW